MSRTGCQDSRSAALRPGLWQAPCRAARQRWLSLLWAGLPCVGAAYVACAGGTARVAAGTGEPGRMEVDPALQLTLTGPDRLLSDGELGIDVGPLALNIESPVPGLVAEVRPGGTLLLLVIPMAPHQQRVCSERWDPRWWPTQFGTVSHGYYEWHMCVRVPATVWFSDFPFWPPILGRLCPGAARVRLYAILVTTRAERVFVFPGDSIFDAAMEAADAVVRRGTRGAPVLVELPAREFVIGGEALHMWGADLPLGTLTYAVSNPLDVELVKAQGGG